MYQTMDIQYSINSLNDKGYIVDFMQKMDDTWAVCVTNKHSGRKYVTEAKSITSALSVAVGAIEKENNALC